MNLADLGSRGASIDKLESQEWFAGPNWLLSEDKWPEQPELKKNRETHGEYKTTEPIFYCNEQETDEWDDLLDRSLYWRTLRVTACILRFVNNCRSKARRDKQRNGPLNTDEITSARNKWVRRVQQKDRPDIQSPGLRLVEECDTGILKCEGRVTNYQPNVIMWGGNAYPLEELETDTDELTSMNRRLINARQHTWQRWKRGYIHALMETHRTKMKGGSVPDVGDILLIVGDEKNRGEWKKGRVLRLVKGKDGVVRGVVLCHNGRRIERPLQLVCPLELKVTESVMEQKQNETVSKNQQVQRNAAKQRIRLQLEDEEDN
jgi:hypothetical protein